MLNYKNLKINNIKGFTAISAQSVVVYDAPSPLTTIDISTVNNYYIDSAN